MAKADHTHLFPIIDAMVDRTIEAVEESGKDKITCKEGCSHCCHLIVEISWEEATQLSNWMEAQPEGIKERVWERVISAAEGAREVFSRSSETKSFMEPTESEEEIPDDVFDTYFYEKNRPCPFLELGKCVAYEARPTPCRLHLVTSPAEHCSRESGESKCFEVPDEVDELSEDASPVIEALQSDGRWGQMAIMVEAVMKERGYSTEGIRSSGLGFETRPKLDQAS